MTGLPRFTPSCCVCRFARKFTRSKVLQEVLTSCEGAGLASKCLCQGQLRASEWHTSMGKATTSSKLQAPRHGSQRHAESQL